MCNVIYSSFYDESFTTHQNVFNFTQYIHNCQFPNRIYVNICKSFILNFLPFYYSRLIAVKMQTGNVWRRGMTCN